MTHIRKYLTGTQSSGNFLEKISVKLCTQYNSKTPNASQKCLDFYKKACDYQIVTAGTTNLSRTLHHSFLIKYPNRYKQSVSF